MRKLFVVLGIATAASLLAFGWLRQNEMEYAQRNFLMTTLIGERNGYILTPPEFVAQPFIRHIEWSPDGNYAILIQTAARFEGEGRNLQGDLRHRVLAWSRKTKRVSVLWESELTDIEIDLQSDVQVVFFKDMPACLLAVREDKFKGDYDSPVWGVYHAPLNGRPAKLGQFTGAFLLAPPEDTQRYVIWYQVDAETMNQVRYFYTPVSPAGKLAEPLPLSPAATEIAIYSFVSGKGDVQWYTDGKQVLVPLFAPPMYDEANDTFIYNKDARYVLWNPRTNQEREIAPAEVRAYEPKRVATLSVDHARQQLQHKGAQGATLTTWLGEGEGATLVAADSALAEVSPQGDALLYVAHGAAFYRSLIVLSRDDLRQMDEEAKIAQYVSQGKQIGLAMMMYAMDYEETFPPNFGNEGVADVLQPYLRNRGLFEVDGAFAFHYRMNGQSLANIVTPAETEVGYLQLSNGRVVIYADGHVKWRPNR
ncbi:MAG: hypothetical protein N2554_07570 [Fimbriimonadales bacterium]|nr:hypothetical protein [Fimbriimonadales bacterium]